jgi:hypothetical protein
MSGKKLRVFCGEALRRKMHINMHEWKHNDRWSSPAQAKAVSYDQVRKMYPQCTIVYPPLR